MKNGGGNSINRKKGRRKSGSRTAIEQ